MSILPFWNFFLIYVKLYIFWKKLMHSIGNLAPRLFDRELGPVSVCYKTEYGCN